MINDVICTKGQDKLCNFVYAVAVVAVLILMVAEGLQ